MAENWDLDGFLAELKTLVSIDSGSEDLEGVARVAAEMQARLQEIGYHGGTIDFHLSLIHI